MRVCPVCSHENGADARFCSSCGAALTAEPPREERKVVTVLFADLVGFTSRAEQLDPEDVRAVLAPYWERLRTELERRGGTVEKFIGDAVMALFGAPVAHEDDPLRAVGAALAIRDWAREADDVQVRIAVNTGEALVLLGARPGEGEGMAAGDVVNTAARLQGAAPVNGVLVGETTYRATRDVIEYAAHEPVVAKGKAEPIPVWEAVQARSRLGMDVERATLPLVGRVRELSVILDAFERAKAEREPQLVTLVGVPGIGKSRLVGEFFTRLEGQPDLVWWRQGRALPYGDGVSFWALGEMVKAQAGVDENDPPDRAEAKLRAAVDAFVEEDERAWVVEHLLPLVGGESRSASGESPPAWRRFFEGMAEERPLVLVFEDMHWADDGLLDFIDHLVDWASGVPILVLATARPELLERRAAWGGGKLNASTIALTPLSDEESSQIIHGVLEQAVLPAETQQALLERVGGNPLYAEQYARLYLERGNAEGLPLPETVHGLIAARLDALSANEKRLLQDAAVYGKVFWAGAARTLAQLDADAAEQALHALERKGMLRRERRSAVAGEVQYAFRHVLVRDVAYGQIPRAARAEKHVLAADWIDALGRPEDHAELVAHHLGAALALSTDDALADRMRRTLRLAGDRALRLHAYANAARLYGDALAVWPSDDERPYVVAAHARAVFRAQNDPDALPVAVDELERIGDVEGAAELAALAANAAWRAGDGKRARTLLERAQALVADRPPSRAQVAVQTEQARFLAIVDDAFLESAAVIENALPAAEALGLDELRASLLGTLGVVRFGEGDLDTAGPLLEESLRVAPPGSGEAARAATNRSLVAFASGDSEETLHWLDLAAEISERYGDRPNLLWLEAGAIESRYYSFGRWDEALLRLDACLEEMEAVGGHYLMPGCLLRRAAILAARDDTDRALADLEAALARAHDNPDTQFRLPTLVGGAYVCQLLGLSERAAALAAEAFETSRRSEKRSPPFQADFAIAQARAGLSSNMFDRFAGVMRTPRVAAALLVWSGRVAEAAEAYAAMSPEEEAVARLYAADTLLAAKQIEEGTAQLHRALAFYRAVGATRIVRAYDETLSAAS
jgi:class 3 adenylate cyclase/tetratricopeptide (TPR) repeat protein